MTFEERLKALRAIQACSRCFAAHTREGRKDKAMAPGIAVHERALTWAYLCNECARLVFEFFEKGNP